MIFSDLCKYDIFALTMFTLFLRFVDFKKIGFERRWVMPHIPIFLFVFIRSLIKQMQPPI